MIKKLILSYRCQKAIKASTELSRGDGRVRFILIVKGKPKIFTKKYLKQLINRRYFRKGVTIAALEKKAIYVTMSRNAKREVSCM